MFDPDSDTVSFAIRLLECEVYSLDDGGLGEMRLGSDCLYVEIAINPEAAKDLRDKLDLYISGKAEPRPPENKPH